MLSGVLSFCFYYSLIDYRVLVWLLGSGYTMLCVYRFQAGLVFFVRLLLLYIPSPLSLLLLLFSALFGGLSPSMAEHFVPSDLLPRYKTITSVPVLAGNRYAQDGLAISHQ